MKANNQGQDILKTKNKTNLDQDSIWWGDTYRMVKEGYRYFWLKALPRLFKKQHGKRIAGLETYGEWHPDARTIWTLKKMEALGNYKRIDKIKAASVLRKQLNDEAV